MSVTHLSITKNRLLAALPEDELRRLAPQFATRAFKKGEFLGRRGEPIEAVFFPDDGVCSQVLTMEDGRMAEVGLIGSEGSIGHMSAFGGTKNTYDLMAQIPPLQGRMLSRRAFLDEMQRGGTLTTLVQKYVVAEAALAGNNAACNALHDVYERAARWLLLVADRVGPRFTISQEFLAMMLGVRRPTATVAAGVLQQAGLIRYRRTQLEVLDLEGLRAASCECYKAIVGLYADLLPPLSKNS